MPWAKVTPVLLECEPGGLCRRRYPGHTHGCPNYGKRAGCPPGAMRWTPDYFDGADVWAVWNAYPFGEHVLKMRAKHPEWSPRQVECCLYWQGTARKQLRSEILRFYEARGEAAALFTVPEAHGVNVTATMLSLGIELDWPPTTHAYQVAIAFMPVTADTASASPES